MGEIMEVYLDNSATTKVYDNVKELMCTVMSKDYGNPSSLHKKGIQAENHIKKAKERIAKTLKVETKEIVFTSGGTESDNLAIIGVAYANARAGKHLITTKIEHSAIISSMSYLEEQGFRITYLNVDEHGLVCLEELKQALCDETILVSLMYLNNEVGAIQPIQEAVQIVKEYKPSILFHVDAIQGYGKYNIYPKKIGIDLLSISAHKIHGPKGVGALYSGEKVKLRPNIFGGGQQKNVRPGTENVAGIAGLGLAVESSYTELDAKVAKMQALKEYFITELKKMEDVKVHVENGAVHIISVGFAGIKSEVLLHTLEEANIFVSSGSACSSNHAKGNNVLTAMNVEAKYLDSTLRFSLSEFTTQEEIDYTLKTLYNYVPMLRKYTKH